MIEGRLRRNLVKPRVMVLLLSFSTVMLACLYLASVLYLKRFHSPHTSSITLRCRALRMQAGPPKDFHKRSQSDRFAQGTKAVLIKSGIIWTGRKNGTEVIHGDILLDKGIIKDVGHLRDGALEAYGSELIAIDAKGAWITPGIIDIHSHLGDLPSPALGGAEDDNSLKGTIQPWLRSLDGLNTHDDSYLLSVAGGVTTALILPGSANAIGMLIRFLSPYTLTRSRWSGVRHQASSDCRTNAVVYVT